VRRRDPLATVVLRRGDEVLSTWALPGCDAIDLAAVGHLARLALTARRQGCAIELRDADPELIGLLGFCGLAEVAGLRGQVVGQAEDGEQVGPEEVVVADDPVP
jgi:hypothetical protein